VGLKHLIAIEKWTCLLALVALGGGMLLVGRHAAFSIAVGAGMMTLNAVAIRRVAQKLGVVLQKKPSVTVMLFNFKLVILIGLVFCALRYLHVEPIPFIIGISVLPFAIMIVAVQSSLDRSADHEEPNG
jgi:hypothetical protein